MDQFGNRFESAKLFVNIVLLVSLAACSVSHQSGVIPWGNIESLLAHESVHRHLHYSSATVCVKMDASNSICRVANNTNGRFVFTPGLVDMEKLSEQKRVLNLIKLDRNSVGEEAWQFQLQDEGLSGKGIFGKNNSVVITDTIYR